MTLGDVATKARFITNTDTTSWPDSQLLIDINIWYHKVVSMILESMDEADFDDARRTNYPIQTTPLIANQRDYTMPVSEKVLKIKRVDLSWDNGATWYRATPFDSGVLSTGIGFTNASSTDVNLDQNFIQSAPRYDLAYNAIWVFPMPLAADVTNGALMRVEWERQIQVFTTSDYSSVITDSTVVPGFDDPFHIMLAYGAAFEYATARQLPEVAQISSKLQEDEMRLKQHYGRKDLDRTLVLKPTDIISYR